MSLPKETMEILKALAPELRESEDERIWEALYDFISDTLEDYLSDYGISKGEALAYLEKQKEQKPSTPKYRVGDVMRTKQESAEGITDGLPVIVSVDDNYYYCTNEKIPISEQEEYEFPPMNMRQKPAEWSEDIIQKAVKEVGLTQHQINWFKTNVFPPKQEWSEEEKEILDSILSHYVLIDKPIDANGIPKEKYISLIKSIRFDTYKNCNSHWKPSKGQMKALSDACCIAFEEERDFHPSLSRLYHDLRKL